MRVLHVSQPTVAGVPVVVRQLATDQAAHGLDVVVASPEQGDLAGWLAGGPARHVAWDATRSPGPATGREVLSLARVVRQVDPDLVHLHSAKAGLAGRLALRGRRPTVFQPHAWSFEAVTGVLEAAARRWERSAARWTTLLVCVSDDERARGQAAGVRAPSVVLPNGVDTARLRLTGDEERRSARGALGLPDRPTVVCVGRLARQKGQDVLLRAVPRLVRRVPDVHVVLVGDGPDAPALRARATSSTRFAGAQADVAPWLVAADVVAVPSRWEAGLPLVAMEAMALGRSVVSTAVAGTPAALEGAGAVVPVDAVDALADAVAQRLLDPARAAREGRRGRLTVEQHYDQRVTAAGMRLAYRRLLDAQGGP